MDLFFLVLIALFATLFHNVVEIKTLKEQLEAAGKTFSFKEHIQRNWVAWLSSLFPIAILALSHIHITKQFPLLEGWMWIIYAVVGWGGSSFFITVLSSSQKRLTAVIQDAANK